MGAPSALSPYRAYDETWEVCGTFTIGASGAHTKQYGGRGISGVARDAAGKFTITFTDVGSQLLDLDVKVHRAANAESLVARPTLDTFSRTAKTAQFEVWIIAENAAAAQADPASGDRVSITAKFLK